LQKSGCPPESGIDQALKGGGNKLVLIVDHVEFSSNWSIRNFIKTLAGERELKFPAKPFDKLDFIILLKTPDTFCNRRLGYIQLISRSAQASLFNGQIKYFKLVQVQDLSDRHRICEIDWALERLSD
jgi:hypothetical protein